MSPMIAAIIVTYFPQRGEVGELIAAVAPQVQHVVVVDNTPSPGASLPTEVADLHVIRNNRNLGLGRAQNVGIAHARQIGADHVILFDQDSVPADDMVAILMRALRELTHRGARVAAVGPRWLDRRTRESAPFVRVGWTGLRHITGDWHEEGFIEADFLIASGSLIPMAALDQIGHMDEGLFIDHVDIEWAFRAASHGFRLYGIRDAVLVHGLGDSRRVVWLGKWWKVPIHSPIRNYYFARNTVVLSFRPYVSWRWRVSSYLRLLGLGTCFVTQIPPRGARLRALLSGVRDGLLGRQGPAPA
jgi:rhamnosyltransferase